jgi:hypothetical protein
MSWKDAVSQGPGEEMESGKDSRRAVVECQGELTFLRAGIDVACVHAAVDFVPVCCNRERGTAKPVSR